MKTKENSHSLSLGYLSCFCYAGTAVFIQEDSLYADLCISTSLNKCKFTSIDNASNVKIPNTFTMACLAF